MEIEARDLTRKFRAVTALDGVSFRLAPGGVTGFIGPNGAGKSTALRILAGRDLPDSGDVLCNGVSLCDYPEKCLAHIGFMPDSLEDSRNTNVLEHLDLALRLHSFKGAARREARDRAIHTTGIEAMLEQAISTLSKGMRQRVSLARILLGDPEILLLDEPAAGLDPRARVELRDILRDLAGQGKTVFLSSHILLELEDLCSRTIIIEHGRIVKDAELHAVTAGTLYLKSAFPAAELAAKLGSRPEVRSAVPENGKVRVELKEGKPAEFAAGLIMEGLPVTGFELAESSLETMFLDATKHEVKS